MSVEPLIRGAWLKPGAHLDLVGAYRPSMREADDTAIARARIYVDTRAGALKEGGDIVAADRRRRARRPKISPATFSTSAGARAEGRRSDEEITLFKSVGTAIEDLAAAVLVYERI